MNITGKSTRMLTGIAFVLILSIPQGFCVEFHVSPEGKDRNPGTMQEPFATVSRARNEVRKRLAEGLKENVTVLICGGTYELSDTLVFTPKDSGTKEISITYAACPGETVILSGGRRISGWKRGKGELWTAKIPGVKEGKWRFRQLFVNGQRAVRARTPNLGDDPAFWRLAGAKLTNDYAEYTLELHQGRLKDWRNPSDAEVVAIGEWEIVRKRIESIDVDKGAVTLAPPHIVNHQAIRPRRGMPCYFENALEMLDRPDEWYLDRQTGLLTYWPRPNEDMTRSVVVAPVLTRLLEISGTAEQPVSNLHFKGIRFEHTDWELPDVGYFGVQACAYELQNIEDYKRTWDLNARKQVDSAIRWRHAHGCSLTEGRIAYTGGSAIWIGEGCSDNTIQGNRIYDIGGNGIMVGVMLNFHYYKDPSYAPRPADVPRRNRIANNHIQNCGVSFHGAVGVWLAFTDGTIVAHNLLHDLPYTGISVGWIWRPLPTVCKNNVIEYNHIHDVMKLLADGGGIYTLGLQPGTVIRGNFIHDIKRSPYAHGAANNGMFIDQGSKGYRSESNVIYGTAGQPVRHNNSRPEWHTWQNNHFGTASHTLGKVAYEEVVKKSGLEPDYQSRMGDERQERRRNVEQTDGH